MGKEKMGPERKDHNQSVFTEKMKGRVRSISEMLSYLPEIDPHDQRFVEAYIRTQLFIVEGRPKKAGRLFGLLDRLTGFTAFEEAHQDLLSAVDIAIRGETRRTANPALNFDHNGEF